MTEEREPEKQSREDMKRSFEKLKKLKEERDAQKAGGNTKAFTEEREPEKQSKDDSTFEKLKKLKEEKDAQKVEGNRKALTEEREPERQSKDDTEHSFEKLKKLKKERDIKKANGNRKTFTEELSKEKKANDGMLLDVEEAKSAARVRERREPQGGMSYAEYKAKRDAAMNKANWVKWVSIPVSLAFIALVGYAMYYGMFLYEEPGDIKIGSSAVYYPVFKWDKAGVYTSLEIIEAASPMNFYMIDANVKTILLYPSYGYKYGKQQSDEDYRAKTIYIMKGFPCPTDCDNQYTGTDLIRAAVIINEACRSMQVNTGQPVSEGQCRNMGYNFVTSMGPVLLPEYNASQYAFLGRAGPYTDLVQGESLSEMLR